MVINLKSLWNGIRKIPSFPELCGDIQTEVLIVGGGMAGILTGYFLGEKGVDYLLIESDEICRGVSGNTTAKITSQHGLIYGKLLDIFGKNYARLYWKANEDAVGIYRRLCENIQCGFEEKNNYIYSVNGADVLFKELDALNRLEIPATFVRKTSLPFETAGAVRFDNQAQFNPLDFVAGIAEKMNICEYTKAREFRGTTVITDKGVIRAKKVIIATHFPIINKHGGYFLKMYQNRSYVIALENAQLPDGMYLDESESGLSFRSYGDLLLLGGGSHRTGKQGSGWEPLEEFAEKFYPDSRIKYRWAAQDCITLDGAPYIGRYGRNISDLFVATGFNKWGMTFSMLSAMILSDAVCGIENKYARLFDPSRKLFLSQLALNICESAANIFTFSKPRCPHLGCALKWNRYEHSWDCPCHGSRFSRDGVLLDNPATDDLHFD